MVRTGDFCELINDNCESDGFPKGSVVWVAGLKPMPIEENDPYLQRIYSLIHPVSGENVNVKELFLVDPRNLSPVANAEELQKQLLLDFDNQGGIDATTH